MEKFSFRLGWLNCHAGGLGCTIGGLCCRTGKERSNLSSTGRRASSSTPHAGTLSADRSVCWLLSIGSDLLLVCCSSISYLASSSESEETGVAWDRCGSRVLAVSEFQVIAPVKSSCVTASSNSSKVMSSSSSELGGVLGGWSSCQRLMRSCSSSLLALCSRSSWSLIACNSCSCLSSSSES